MGLTSILGITSAIPGLVNDVTTLLPTLSFNLIPLPTVAPPIFDLFECPTQFFCPTNTINGSIYLSPNPYSLTFNVTCESCQNVHLQGYWHSR
jgi:hypothetical protein